MNEPPVTTPSSPHLPPPTTFTGPVSSPAPDVSANGHALPARSAHEVGRALATNLSKVVLGQHDAIELVVAALLASGHVLVEDTPGVGKTLLAKSMAASIDGRFRRIQATPDLLPTELTGTSVYEPSGDVSSHWVFRPGPLFANVVLVDELNRATPRTQSALLESMAEGQVSADGTSHLLPSPFFVFATQNPHEHVGTFPLVEGQRDRFIAVLTFAPMSANVEHELVLGSGGIPALDSLSPVASLAELHAAVRECANVLVSPLLAQYSVGLVRATRVHPAVELGASPRASLALIALARSHAVLSDRTFVSVDDVKAVVVAALAHRLTLKNSQALQPAIDVINDVVNRATVPRQ